jgi:hypothetical protein
MEFTPGHEWEASLYVYMKGQYFRLVSAIGVVYCSIL